MQPGGESRPDILVFTRVGRFTDRHQELPAKRRKKIPSVWPEVPRVPLQVCFLKPRRHVCSQGREAGSGSGWVLVAGAVTGSRGGGGCGLQAEAGAEGFLTQQESWGAELCLWGPGCQLQACQVPG